MQPVALTGAAYEARSRLADAQRCVNLYPERNPEGSPFPFSYYPTPGLVSYAECPNPGVARGLYRTSTNVLLVVVGNRVFRLESNHVWTQLGTIADGTSPVSMADNRQCAILVDGTSVGYVIDLGSLTVQTITDQAFLGADRVDYVDTYFVFNKPRSNNYYISKSNVTTDMLTGNGVAKGEIEAAGSGYPHRLNTPPYVYTDVPLVGGSGHSIRATVTVKNTGEIQSVVLTNPGSGYVVGDSLGVTLGGKINGTTIVSPGSGYTNGSYLGLPVTGGSGQRALASVTVAGGIVTAFTISDGVSTSTGYAYKTGDVISVSIPGGSGFSATVNGVTSSGSGFVYSITEGISNGFDPLDIASKTGASDSLITLIVMKRDIWLLGDQTSEVHYNTGASDFTFGIMPGVFVEHGCSAVHSVAKADLSVFWLGKDKQGKAIVLMGTGYAAIRISTNAIEKIFQGYGKVNDAVGWTYQQDGHVFYVISFPTADATWAYDLETQQWHERTSIDDDGAHHQQKAIFSTAAFGELLTLDPLTGDAYSLDLDTFTDDGAVVPRLRSFSHLVSGDDNVVYSRFIAHMEPGDIETDEDPKVTLRYSNDGGKTFGNGATQSLGKTGEYQKSLLWTRLGMARDRVFELSWSANTKTALLGAMVQVDVCNGGRS